jgi:hypothetical protein
MASTEAIALWVRCGTWSARYLTDGEISREAALYFGTQEAADDLVRTGLWQRARGGYRMARIAQGSPVELWRIHRHEHRNKIPDSVRQAVFDRDGYACLLCGATDDLTLDHIRPWSLGGPDTVRNLRVLCRPCNSRKGARV